MFKKFRNRLLIKKYPFLLPRNRFTGEVSKDYDYSYTELDAMPTGWRKAFGLQMCEDIKKALIRDNISLEDYRILDIKEKYGTLRWYANGTNDDLDEIIYKYEKLSWNTCIMCGKQAKYSSKGWISPYCSKCVAKICKEQNSFILESFERIK